jgi:predicted Zn-dependent protease
VLARGAAVAADPIQWLRCRLAHPRARGAGAGQPANAVAARAGGDPDDGRRPARALPHLAAARAREPADIELQLLEGQAQALAGRHAEAATSFAAIGERSPKFRYGAPWMARADALAAVGQWAEADAALARFQAVNSSSVEGHVKRARARARQGDAAGARRERAAGRALYGELPRFQRRHQRWWYARALIGW